MFSIFKAVLEKLENQKIDYMVVGSIASIIYGEPRMTKDMDIVIQVNHLDAQSFEELFPYPEYYCPPKDILSSEFSEQGQFNILHQDSGIKVDFIVRKNSPHAKMEFERKKRIVFWENQEAYIATAEDVILKKLSFYREGRSEKHLRDIRGILAQSKVDKDYLEAWVKTLKLEDEWLLL